MKTYAEIKQEVDARSAEDWFHVLDNVEKCADREHTVVHLPFSSCWIFTTGQDCRWCMDPAPRCIFDQETVEAIARRLATYDFCVLSHLHADHYDKRLLTIMAESRTLHWVRQMRHCQRCRADAIGKLGQDVQGCLYSKKEIN